MVNRALVIDDDKVTLELFTFELKSEGFEVTTAESGKAGLEYVRDNDFEVILTDLNLPDINGIEMVRLSKALAPQTEIIVVTGLDSTEKAVEAIRVGARDYIVKPVDFEKLLVVIKNAVESKKKSEINARQAAEIQELRGRLTSRTSYEGVIGGAHSMQNIYEMIENVAESDANILILGESGTGKEVIANAIHYKSHRAGKPFVKVNCSALPKDLIESQLFGHMKGSFTGANADKTGFIGQASGGSILLDEIGEMPIDLQPKLLRVLQEKVYYRVGSDKPQDADFRLICSTNRRPFEAIKDGNLREDLYYRINTIEIEIPPLRDRMDDVPMLAEHFLQVYSDKYKRKDLDFTQNAYNQMLNYSWRGNVRELQHVIERAVLLSKSNKISSLNIPGAPATERPEIPAVSFAGIGVGSGVDGAATFAAAAAMPKRAGVSMIDADLSGEELFQEIGKFIVEKLPEPADGAEQKDIFNDLESGVVLAALKRTRGNKQAAANLLGLYRPRLYGMIKRHNLEDQI
ncbi:MAG: sigma-54 dependent transcriptional regulator [Acidobacteriota bacterium]